MSNYGTSSSSGWKGKEKERDIEDRELEINANIPHELHSPVPQPISYPKTRGEINIDQDSGVPFSKDHITSSFDKATSLSNETYSNKIMNEPHLTSEEQINKEKYEEAKHHFDELYRDILATEDLKNHPELIEELNRISSSSSNSNLECRNGPSMSIPHDTMSKSEASTSIAPPPVSNDDNGKKK